MSALILTDARVVTPSEVLDPGWVSIHDDQITAVGAGAPADALDKAVGGRRHDNQQHDDQRPDNRLSLNGQWLLPGLVDVHVHGGGGHSLMARDPAEIAAAVDFHRRHGTTRMLASLVTAPVPVLLRTLAVLAELTEDGVVAGCHLEGPFLSAARCGAQDPRHMLDPDPTLLDQLLDAGRGTVKVVTVAPERPGAVELVHQMVDRGVVAAVGHTDATYAQTMTAIEAGARVATHLFNGMRPIHHREPGPVLAVLARPEVVCEIIADGVHLHPATVAHVATTVGARRMALITDATMAAGMPDGRYPLGPVTIEVHQGVARLAGGGSIAGSTLTMDRAVRNAVHSAGLSVPDAARTASTTPASLLGLDGRAGSIQPGADADLAVFDDTLGLVAVMARGRWVDLGPKDTQL